MDELLLDLPRGITRSVNKLHAASQGLMYAFGLLKHIDWNDFDTMSLPDIWRHRMGDDDPCDAGSYDPHEFGTSQAQTLRNERELLNLYTASAESVASYNFVYGVYRDPKKPSNPVLRVGRVLSPGSEQGIKHFQLCNGTREGDCLYMIFSGVLHVDHEHVVVTPLSGRWAGMKEQVLRTVRRSTVTEHHSPMFKLLSAVRLMYGTDADQVMDIMMDALMTSWVIRRFQKADTSSIYKFDACWGRLIADYAYDAIKYDGDERSGLCWKEAADR